MSALGVLRNRFSNLLSNEGFTVALVLIALVILLSISSPFFLTARNITNVLDQSVFVLLVALGITFVLITGGIDLSVGSVMGISGGITGIVLMNGAPMILAVGVGLVTGFAVGIVNGLIITKLRIPDFIVTLAMLALLRGALQVIEARTPIRFQNEAFTFLASGSILGIRLPVIISAIIILVLAFVLRSTHFGRTVFAVGINPEAAHLSGIDVDRVRVKVFALSGLLAAASGILLAAQLSSVQAAHGEGYLLISIAAAVVGGTSLTGGRGTIWGTVVGALLVAVINNGLRLLEVNAFWFDIVIGAIILFAVVLDRTLQRFAESQARSKGQDKESQDKEKES